MGLRQVSEELARMEVEQRRRWPATARYSASPLHLREKMLEHAAGFRVVVGNHVFPAQHVNGGRFGSLLEQVLADRYLVLGDVSEEDFMTALNQGQRISGGRRVLLECGMATACQYCGEYPSFTFDGRTIRAKRSCAVPDGPFEFGINVPSGRLVMSKEHDPLVPVYNDDLGGTRAFGLSRLLASQLRLMGHLYVAFGSNHNLAVYPTGGSRKLVVRNTPEEGESDPAAVLVPHQILSLLDEAVLERHGGTTKERVVLQVEPGVYRGRLFYECDRRWHDLIEADRRHPHLELEWIRSPEPLRDDVHELERVQLTLGQVVRGMQRRYPESFEYSVNALDTVFGSPYMPWHPRNGCPIILDVSANDPEAELPVIEDTVYEDWGRLSRSFGAIERAAKGEIVFAPTFLAAARSILALFINTLDTSNERRAHAQSLLDQLNARYP